MIRTRRAICLTPPAAGLLVLMLWPVSASAQLKLTDDDKVDILRGILSEYATVKVLLPRSKKPLPFQSDGVWNKEIWNQSEREFGAAARVGDLVQVTHLDIDSNKMVIEINNGMKGPRGSWKNHVQIGMGGPAMTPINTQQNSNAPSGTSIVLLFGVAIPDLQAADIKKILAPVLDFDKHSAADNYFDSLPEPIQKAIKANKVIKGMNRDQVLLSMGRPRQKERDETPDGDETEDWIYGDPPGKITFVTFTGSTVTNVKEAYADLGGSTAPPLVAK
ncbi:MAG TPA: hypothetical protein VME17_19870 [Bryobacteraceae bacterium]|nr:hypothetical protein [Bryobacteraceae bacterium]